MMHQKFDFYAKQLSDSLGESAWFAGPNLTYADFTLYEMLEIVRLHSPHIFEGKANLNDFRTRFEALPAVKAHWQSDKAIRWPVFSPEAKWGGREMKAPF